MCYSRMCAGYFERAVLSCTRLASTAEHGGFMILCAFMQMCMWVRLDMHANCLLKSCSVQEMLLPASSDQANEKNVQQQETLQALEARVLLHICLTCFFLAAAHYSSCHFPILRRICVFIRYNNVIVIMKYLVSFHHYHLLRVNSWMLTCRFLCGMRRSERRS